MASRTGNKIQPIVQVAEVLKSIECPICLEIPIRFVFLCQTGHFACSSCRHKVKACPICGKGFTIARNFAVESLISSLEIRCKNMVCTEIIKAAAIQHHVKKCEYRPIVCNNNNRKGNSECQNVLVDREEYVSHLREVHKTQTQAIINGWSPIVSRRWLVPRDEAAFVKDESCRYYSYASTILEDDAGQTFFLNIVQDQSQVFAWVAMLSSDDKDNQYLADIYIGGSDDLRESNTVTKAVWTVRVPSVHTLLQEIQYTNYCAAVPFRSLVLSLSELSKDMTFRFCVKVQLRQVGV